MSACGSEPKALRKSYHTWYNFRCDRRDWSNIVVATKLCS